jgi:hypothetical protein
MLDATCVYSVQDFREGSVRFKTAISFYLRNIGVDILVVVPSKERSGGRPVLRVYAGQGGTA